MNAKLHFSWGEKSPTSSCRTVTHWTNAVITFDTNQLCASARPANTNWDSFQNGIVILRKDELLGDHFTQEEFFGYGDDVSISRDTSHTQRKKQRMAKPGRQARPVSMQQPKRPSNAQFVLAAHNYIESVPRKAFIDSYADIRRQRHAVSIVRTRPFEAHTQQATQKSNAFRAKLRQEIDSNIVSLPLEFLVKTQYHRQYALSRAVALIIRPFALRIKAQMRRRFKQWKVAIVQAAPSEKMIGIMLLAHALNNTVQVRPQFKRMARK